MSRRIYTCILFVTVALYGAQLPQLVHHLVDHGCGDAAPAAQASCCSASCSIAHDQPADEQDEHSHDCSICEMLATSFAMKAVVAAVSAVCLPAAEHRASCERAMIARRGFEQHSPRAPPAHI